MGKAQRIFGHKKHRTGLYNSARKHFWGHLVDGKQGFFPRKAQNGRGKMLSYMVTNLSLP